MWSNANLRVLMITSEWPTPLHPHSAPFIVRQADFLRRAGVEIDVFHFRGAKSLLKYARAWREAHKKIASGNYNLVHAQWGQSALLALPKRLPLVVTFRGDDLEGIVGKSTRYTLAGWILKAISQLCARAADRVIVVSGTLGHRLARPYQIIPSGLDLELFRPIPQREGRARLGLSPTRKLVLFAGTAGNPRKRYGLAREAVDLLKEDFDVELVIASDIPNRLMPIYMGACDVLVLTSIHEGSPNVVKEALACDLPIVSVAVGDVPERIATVPGCVLCKDDRPETIAKGLASVLRNGQRIRGRRTVLHLDEEILAARVIAIYKEAVRRHSK